MDAYLFLDGFSAVGIADAVHPMVNWSSSACGSRNDWCQEGPQHIPEPGFRLHFDAGVFLDQGRLQLLEKTRRICDGCPPAGVEPGRPGLFRDISEEISGTMPREIPAASSGISGENCPGCTLEVFAGWILRIANKSPE